MKHSFLSRLAALLLLPVLILPGLSAGCRKSGGEGSGGKTGESPLSDPSRLPADGEAAENAADFALVNGALWILDEAGMAEPAGGAFSRI